MSVLISVYDNTSHIYENDFCLYQEFRFDATEKEKINEFINQMVIDHGKAVVVSMVENNVRR